VVYNEVCYTYELASDVPRVVKIMLIVTVSFVPIIMITIISYVNCNSD